MISVLAKYLQRLEASGAGNVYQQITLHDLLEKGRLRERARFPKKKAPPVPLEEPPTEGEDEDEEPPVNDVP